MTDLFQARRLRRIAAIGALTLLCGGCAALERAEIGDTEQMLSAAGFVRQAAGSPDTDAKLAALPPHNVLAEPIHPGTNDGIDYVYADPDQCHCVFVGNAEAYQAYRRLALEKRIADERALAAEQYEDTAFDWTTWGPPYWMPPPPVALRPAR